MKKLGAFDEDELPPLAIQAYKGCLIVPVPYDLHKATLMRLQQDLLHKIHESEHYNILLDMAGITLLDSYAFERLVEIIGMIGLMGGRVLLVGIQPGVASSLVIMEVDLDAIDTVISIEEGISKFNPTIPLQNTEFGGDTDEELPYDDDMEDRG